VVPAARKEDTMTQEAGKPDRRCTGCGALKPVSAFYIDHGKPRSKCKACRGAQKAAYRATNPKKERERSAAYRAANPKKVRAKNAAYYAANQDKVSAQNAAYRAANPDRRRAMDARSRARRKGVTPGRYIPDLIFARAGWICDLCGGLTDPNAHLRCNMAKGTRSYVDFLCDPAFRGPKTAAPDAWMDTLLA
jgi:hypothetical protein